MKQLENYWYNLYINQKAIIDFEFEKGIEYNCFDYNDCAIIGYIIFMLKSDIKGFTYKHINDRKYILLRNNLLLDQLPKLKKTMLNKRLEKLEKKGILFREIEGDNMRFLSVNTELLNKSSDSMIYHSEFLKKTNPDLYNNILEYFKKKYAQKEIDLIIEQFDLQRTIDQENYNPKDIYKGLITYFQKWKPNKYDNNK